MKEKFVVYYTETVFIPAGVKEPDIRFIPLKKDSKEEFIPFSGFFLDYTDFTMLSEKNVINESKAILWNFENLKEVNTSRYIENIYFEFRSFPDINDFKQILRNYKNCILHSKEKHDLLALKAREDEVYKKILNVGIALSAERENQKLLDYIVEKTREITFSDAGSLYLVDENRETGKSSLLFKIAHNDSNPTDFTEFSMPIMKQSIAGYVALTSEVIKLDNVYDIPKEAEYEFNSSYDVSTGYRSKSMLTVPMKNHKGKIIGVIQLINKKVSPEIRLDGQESVEKYVRSFDSSDQEVVLSLASLAAVSLDNNQLYNEIENLFECLVKASAKAIEQRDPATSGHSLRVAKYTVALAEAVSNDVSPLFRDICFSADHLKGIRYACLLHDFGKVGVRENVLVKAKKLYPGMLDLILLRLDYIKKKKEADLIKNVLDNKQDSNAEDLIAEETEKMNRLKDIITDLNETSILSSDPEELLSIVESEKYVDDDNEEKKIITSEESGFLSIKRGCLNSQERDEIQSHVVHTYDFLKNIPWPEYLSDIPEIARGHHEMLDGSGYPDGKKGDEILFESKMMAVADIYDALTASDRPYKRAVPSDKALNILKAEADDGKLDKNIVDFFIDKRIYEIPEQ